MMVAHLIDLGHSPPNDALNVASLCGKRYSMDVFRRSLISSALLLGACAPEPSSQSAQELSQEGSSANLGSSAVLFVERQFGVAPAGQVQVGARFVRYSGISSNALGELLGFPTSSERLGCLVRDTSATTAEPPSRAQVQLLDVGRLEVQTEHDGILLEPRRLPDLFHVVSGVVYAGEGAFTGNTWHFRADGSSASRVPSFSLSAAGPEPLTSITLGTSVLSAVEASHGVSLAEGSIALRWPAGESGDRVMIELTSPSAPSIVCVADDALGAFEIERSWRDRMSAHDTVMVLHRLRSRSFTLASMEHAAMVFDFSLRVPLR